MHRLRPDDRTAASPTWRDRLRAQAALLRDEFTVLRRAAADPRCPRRVRWAMLLTAAYIVSPIDLIPDFLPVIGQLDELVLVPLALRWVQRRIPAAVLEEYRAVVRAAAEQREGGSESY